ncbi:22374_t:CDS:2 [Gigaspora margarita]|uniref:22374_t:CDS:1 n=1 Tax=Gigaspora margarita TaxID=4874 RepID=A0ABN7UQG2_GIGMA|nr:22374_t:CDS:2 [Gigaspora margarita]
MNTNFKEYDEEKIYRLQEHWDYNLEPKLEKIPTNHILLNVKIYSNQFETVGESIGKTDNGIFEAAKRECKKETGYKPEDKRMQLILNYQYLSNNKN